MQINATHLRHVARRAGMLVLALFLIACSAGLGYVVHLTRITTEQRVESAGHPSLLPLMAMAALAAIGGLVTLRLALHRPDGE